MDTAKVVEQAKQARRKKLHYTGHSVFVNRSFRKIKT